MSSFREFLLLKLLRNSKNEPLENRSGKQLYQVASRFSYFSDEYGQVVVPAGFVTDLASIPRLPFFYMMLGDSIQEPAVIHDYLYSTGILSRKDADNVLLEAMEVTGISWFKRHLIYWGVRIGGNSSYDSPGT